MTIELKLVADKSKSMIAPLVFYEGENKKQYIDVESFMAGYNISRQYLLENVKLYVFLDDVTVRDFKTNNLLAYYSSGLEVIPTERFISFCLLSLHKRHHIPLMGIIYDQAIWLLEKGRKESQNDFNLYAQLDEHYYFNTWRFLFSGMIKADELPSFLDRLTEFIEVSTDIIPEYRSTSFSSQIKSDTTNITHSISKKTCRILNALAHPDKFTNDKGESVYRFIEQIQKQFNRHTIRQILLFGFDPYCSSIKNLIEYNLVQENTVLNLK